jgi:tetratricopeptide (TPR) repeat protein
MQTLAIAYHRRGTAYASKKEYDQAIADYTKALEIDPKYISALNDRGLAYTSKGDYERAIADVTRAASSLQNRHLGLQRRPQRRL